MAKNENTMNTMPNDPTGGVVGVDQYNTWRTYFGQAAGSGAVAISIVAIPEPATWTLIIAAVASVLYAEASDDKALLNAHSCPRLIIRNAHSNHGGESHSLTGQYPDLSREKLFRTFRLPFHNVDYLRCLGRVPGATPSDYFARPVWGSISSPGALCPSCRRRSRTSFR